MEKIISMGIFHKPEQVIGLVITNLLPTLLRKGGGGGGGGGMVKGVKICVFSTRHIAYLS